MQTLWKRRAALLRQEKYHEVPELVQVMEMLEKKQFQKMVVFTKSPEGEKTRTNNHVERANRRIRFAEKVRYKWRRRKWVVRFVLLGLDCWWRRGRVGDRRRSGQQSGGVGPRLLPGDRYFRGGDERGVSKHNTNHERTKK